MYCYLYFQLYAIRVPSGNLEARSQAILSFPFSTKKFIVEKSLINNATLTFDVCALMYPVYGGAVQERGELFAPDEKWDEIG